MPDTVTFLSGTQMLLSSAVILIKSEPVVEPAGIDNVRFPLSSQSPSHPETETSTSVSAAEGLLRRAVTVAAPRFSEIVFVFNTSVTLGVSSSSMIHNVAVLRAIVAPVGLDSSIWNRSLSPSSTLSLYTPIDGVLLVSPGANLNQPPAGAKSTLPCAPSSRNSLFVVYCTVTPELDGGSRVTSNSSCVIPESPSTTLASRTRREEPCACTTAGGSDSRAARGNSSHRAGRRHARNNARKPAASARPCDSKDWSRMSCLP